MRFFVGVLRVLPLLVFPLAMVGCSEPAPAVVEHPVLSDEAKAKADADYDAQMDAN